jgi:hypothetical protein
MKQEGKDKIITRAIHFIATKTKYDSYRIGQAIIAELELVKNLTIPVVIGQSEQLFCGVDGGYCPMERKKDKKCLADFKCINQVTK